MGKSTVSCRFSLKPIHWNNHKQTTTAYFRINKTWGSENCFKTLGFQLKWRDKLLLGGWATYPSEKWWSESQLGFSEIPNIWKNEKWWNSCSEPPIRLSSVMENWPRKQQSRLLYVLPWWYHILLQWALWNVVILQHAFVNVECSTHSSIFRCRCTPTCMTGSFNLQTSRFKVPSFFNPALPGLIHIFCGFNLHIACFIQHVCSTQNHVCLAQIPVF